MQKYSEEVKRFITENVVGQTTVELMKLVNDKFGTDFTVSRMRAYKKNHNLKSGINCQFTKGQTSHNKGKKGQCAPGSEKGWFKPGDTPQNHKPVGSERIDSKDGYTLIKTAEPHVWELKHKCLYESVHGKIPDDHVVIFLDSDKTNITIDNLQAISMAESLELNMSKLRFSDADLTRTGLLIVKIKRSKFDKTRCKR